MNLMEHKLLEGVSMYDDEPIKIVNYRGRRIMKIGNEYVDNANIARQLKEILKNREKNRFNEYIVAHFNTYIVAIKTLGENNGKIKF